jgi:hypothetical protein
MLRRRIVVDRLAQLVMLAAGVLVGVVVLRALLGTRQARRSFRVIFPRELPAEALVAALRGLHGLLPGPWRRLLRVPAVVLETIGSGKGITHWLSVAGADAEQVLGQLRAALPGVRIIEEPRPRPTIQVARELCPVGGGRLRSEAIAATNVAILGALQPAEGMIVVQWVLVPIGAGPLAWLAWRWRQLAGKDLPPRSGRAAEPPFVVSCRVGIAGGSPGRLLARVIGALATASTEDRRLRRRLLPSAWVADRLRRASVPSLGSGSGLAGDELAAVLGVPVAGPQLEGLTLSGSRQLPVAPAVSRTGRVLADALAAGRPRPVALTELESARGLLLTAPTGSGKSTVLEHLCAQDFAAGRGVVAVESKGDLVAALADLVPPERLDEVVVFDPADRRPVGFNLLTAGEDAAELIVDHVVGQFRALYATYLGPRSEMLLRAALLSLAGSPEPLTICEVIPALTDAGLRRRLAASISDDTLAGVWAWFDGQTAAAQAEMVSPLVNKLAAFTLRRRVRAVVGQAVGGLDLDAVLADGRIALISLSKGTVGEEAASLIGSCLLARLWAAIQARAAVPPQQRRFVSVVLDEAQDFLRLPVALGDAVAQSRGMNVGWTVAHQNLGQLTPELRRAVLANLRSKLVLQTSADDAHTFAREFAPHVNAADLQGLGPFEGYAALSTGAAVAPPASIITRPAPARAGLGTKVRDRSRARYGRAPAEVEDELRARLAGTPRETAVGQRRQQ